MLTGCKMYGQKTVNAPEVSGVPLSWTGEYTMERAPEVPILWVHDGAIYVMGAKVFPPDDGDTDFTEIHCSQHECWAGADGEAAMKYSRDPLSGCIEYRDIFGTYFVYIPFPL
ncbi:hypothetical protein [Spirochaeta dissipatitropha]